MSPVSRARKKSGRIASRSRKQRTLSSPFAPILSVADQLRGEESVLVAESWASYLLGRIWAAGWSGDVDDPDDFMQDQVEKLINYMAGQPTPAGLAVLRALTLVGEDWARDLAGEAAQELAGLDVPEPAWAGRTEVAELTGAFSMGELFGDIEVIILGFRRAGTDHAVGVLLDHALHSGILKILIGEAEPDGLTGLAEVFNSDGSLADPVPLTAAEARARLEDALGEMLDNGPSDLPWEEMAAADAEDDPAGGWALLRARLDLLPDDLLSDEFSLDELSLDDIPFDVLVADAGLVDIAAEDDEAGQAVAQFLASDHAQTLPDREVARIWARMAADWAIESGRDPQRYGPLSLGYFLMLEVTEHIAVRDADLALLPAAIRAWAHFTVDARGLGAEAHHQWDEQLTGLLDEFAEAYTEPDAVEHRATCPDVVAFRSYEAETSVEALVEKLHASAPAGVRSDAARLLLVPSAPPAAEPAAEGTVHQIKVLLRGSKPPIWRRLEVPSTVTLGDLHDVVQAAFDWDDDHLWVFRTDYGQFGPTPDLGDRDPDGVTLGQIATEGVRFRYIFDFGDNLEHELTVEKILPAAGGTGYPRCTGGRQPDPVQYPSEDEDEEERVRAGAVFDKAAVNTRLARLQA